MNDKIKDKIRTLPEKPGTYQMLDAAGKIIYVGKAKNLKRRVGSYFVGVHDDKTTRLVKEIDDFQYIITGSEKEAFLLEISQIKKNMPKYNIQFTGDNTYPYIEITEEKYPRLKITRNVSKHCRNLFGPFPDSSSANQTLKVLGIIFPFRKCQNMPNKICLYYFIHQCLGPCEFEVSSDEYKQMAKKVRSFLSGNTKEYLDLYKDKMEEHSRNLEFEKASEYRDLITAIERTTEQQQVILPDNLNRDIINWVTYDNYVTVNILFMRQGRLLFSRSKIISYYLNPEEVLLNYLVEHYEKNPLPDEILLPEGYDYDVFKEILGDIIFIPQRGKKKRLLEMAAENAKEHMEHNLKTYLNKENKTILAMTELEGILGLQSLKRIDAFDNSNTAGQDLVSAMVVFDNGLPNKNQYRKYKIRTVDNSDDYHMMQEVIYRRYQNVLAENLERPDLIIVDGGIHQVRAGKEVLNQLGLVIPIIGLKKDDTHRTDAILKEDETVIKLDRHSNLYSLLYAIQEEVHRFAISFHRNVAGKSIYASILDTIPKIGKTTKEKLLKKYKNLENIRNASREELRELKLTNAAIDNLFLALKDMKSR